MLCERCTASCRALCCAQAQRSALKLSLDDTKARTALRQLAADEKRDAVEATKELLRNGL